MNQSIDELSINTIRFLSVDAVQKANSGHPGAPLGAAVMAYSLWIHFLKHNPKNPQWIDRDRFILSAGHASALLYSILNLTGYDVSVDDLKNFRQWGSKTPGHPEFGLTPGVEATTGPLGQGFTMGVGMAIAERWLAEHFNKPGQDIIDHFTYAIVSDGDMMEGISSEAASLAGTLKLGKLIYLYDDNNVTIEGKTDNYFSENVAERFCAYGWQVIGPIDGMNLADIDQALEQAQNNSAQPSLIICRTVIGYGSPNKAGTGTAHGEPLGEKEVLLAKQNLGWGFAETFYVPPEVKAHMLQAVEEGAKAEAKWQARFDAYKTSFPDDTRTLIEEYAGELPAGWRERLGGLFKPEDKPLATREASGKVLNVLAEKIHSLIGGSADLAPSTKTFIEGESFFSAQNRAGHNLQFGVREHAMGAIANGLALHGGIIPYTATFLIFSDYMRPPVRLAALMKRRVIFIFTHDSVGLGEDGPTHQPIEQLIGLRSVPQLVTLRPADATETAVAWQVAIERQSGPTALVLTRQKLPILSRVQLASADGVRRGAYVLWQSAGSPEIILIATGSEVHLALEAAKELQASQVRVRVVSMPSWELFEAQDSIYKESVLSSGIKARISIEAASTLGWSRYAGDGGISIGIDHFGASAPGNILFEKFGFTSENIVSTGLKLLGRV